MNRVRLNGSHWVEVAPIFDANTENKQSVNYF